MRLADALDLRGRAVRVPADISSAAFFLVGAAIWWWYWLRNAALEKAPLPVEKPVEEAPKPEGE